MERCAARPALTQCSMFIAPLRQSLDAVEPMARTLSGKHLAIDDNLTLNLIYIGRAIDVGDRDFFG